MNLHNKYFLLRHGQTIYQKENRKMSYPNEENPFIPITDEGEEMIKKAAENLKRIRIDLIFASPFLRAKQSAEIAANIIGIKEINYDERLVDINLGELAGRPQEEADKFLPEGKSRFKKKSKNGENWNDALARVKSFLDDVEKKYKNKNILIVSHADPIWLMACYLKGFKTEEQFLTARKTKNNNLYPEVGQMLKI